MLYGITTDTLVGVDIWNVSETHYVLGRKATFVTWEIALVPSEPCSALYFCLHGSVRPANTALNRRYRRLFKEGNVSDEQLALQVVDFRESVFDERLTRTNEGYESVGLFAKIVTISKMDSVRYRGCAALVPSCEWEVQESNRNSTILRATPNRPPAAGATGFEPGEIYLFRLGVMVDRPNAYDPDENPSRLDQFLKERVIGDWSEQYNVHAFSWPNEQKEDFATDFRDGMRRGSVSLDMRPWVQRAIDENRLKIVETDGEVDAANDNDDEATLTEARADVVRDTATSDVWIVTSSQDAVSESELKNTLLGSVIEPDDSWGLFTQPSAGQRFSQAHVYLKENVYALSDRPKSIPQRDERERIELAFETKLFGLSLKSIIGSWIRYLSIFPIALAIFAIMTSNDREPFNDGELGIAIVAILAFSMLGVAIAHSLNRRRF